MEPRYPHRLAGSIIERLLTGSSSSSTQQPMKVSSLAPPVTNVIVNMESSGAFLLNVATVLNATGMNLEELFKFLAEAVQDQARDRFVQTPLVNGRLPDVEIQTITSILGELTEQLGRSARHIVLQDGDFRLLSVDELDDSAIIAIEPPAERSKRITPAGTDAFSRSSSVARNTARLAKSGRVLRIKGCGKEHAIS